MINTLLHWLARLLLKIFGWHTEGRPPDFSKYVLVAAPHTSNWDFPVTLTLAFALKIKIFWMGKDSLFRRPFGTLAKWLGGVPVDRTKTTGTTARAIQSFDENEKFVLVIAPEGTRTRVEHWKTGFYHIAQGANVPLVLGFIDYPRKLAGIGPTVIPTGNIESDMERIQAFYSNITGKHAHKSDAASIRIKTDKD